MKKFINLSIVFGIIGLALGVYFREATKFVNFYETAGARTQLAFTHVHALVLGTLLMLIVGILLHIKGKTINDIKIPLIIYIIGLSGVILMMVVRGSLQVFSKEPLSKGINGMISGIAGFTHLVLAIGLIYLFFNLRKIYSEKAEE